MSVCESHVCVSLQAAKMFQFADMLTPAEKVMYVRERKLTCSVAERYVWERGGVC